MVTMKGLEFEINKIASIKSTPTTPLRDIKPNSYDLNKKHLMLI